MQVSGQFLFGSIAIALLFLVVFSMLLFKRMGKRDALASEAARSDLEANRRSARRDGPKRSETILTLPTYERDVDREEERRKLEAEIKRLEAEPETPANQILTTQLKSEVARLNRLSSSSSDSSILSTSPITVPPPTYAGLDTIGSGPERPS